MKAILWFVEYGATFIETFLAGWFCGSFINKSKNIPYKKILVISVIASVCVTSMNRIELYSPITALISVIFFPIVQLLIYPRNIIKSVSFGLLFLLTIALIDTAVVNSVSLVFEISINELYNEQSKFRVLAILASKSILLLIVASVNKFFRYKNSDILKLKNLIMIFVISLLLLILTITLAFRDMQSSVDSLISVLFFTLLLLLIFIMFFGLFSLTEYYNNKRTLHLTQLKNEMLKQSISESENTFMLWKESVHDYKHNIVNLLALAEKDDMDGIKQYLNEQREILGKKLFYYQTGNDTVDTILNIKQRIAESKHIVFSIRAEIPNECIVNPSDFAVMLGNLLDNSIEASEKEDNPFIEVRIKTIKNTLIIAISNKCSSISTSFETSKPDKMFHGIGLRSVKKIVNKYNGEFSTEYLDNTFIAKVMINL